MSCNDIVFDVKKGNHGDLGIITLNRPKALNALNQNMCILLHEQLKHWQDDDNIKAVIIQGAGDKAFCAGGDIKHIYDNGPEKSAESSRFFWHEYRMNHAIYHFTKPYIALLDGITMGGGCGVSMHGSHRVGTEFLMLAMPETGIGLFPDVGGGYFLSRLCGHIGCYLGLTGNRIDVDDALYCGLITHAVAREKLDGLVETLANTEFDNDANACVSHIINTFSKEAATSALEQNSACITSCFSKNSIDGIISALTEQADNAFAAKALKSLNTKSPSSIVITHEQLNRAKEMSFDNVLKMEFNLAWSMIEQPDFYEGVRAALIDKDRNPKWQPATLADIDNNTIQKSFENHEITLQF